MDYHLRMDALVAAVVAKGYEISNYTTALSYTPQSKVWAMTMDLRDKEYNDVRTIRRSCSPEDFDNNWDSFAAEILIMPTLVEWKRGQFREKMLQLAEESEALGFALEYGAMLRATAEKMASNAITGPTGEEWRTHTPGDPCPATGHVEVRLRGGALSDGDAWDYTWESFDNSHAEIIAWRPVIAVAAV